MPELSDRQREALKRANEYLENVANTYRLVAEGLKPTVLRAALEANAMLLESVAHDMQHRGADDARG
jgi:hypothetical protein